MPVAERQQESEATWLAPSAGRLVQLAGYAVFVPGRESVLTWAGEPLKMRRGNRPNRGIS